jgi:hypothetical protein
MRMKIRTYTYFLSFFYVLISAGSCIIDRHETSDPGSTSYPPQHLKNATLKEAMAKKPRAPDLRGKDALITPTPEDLACENQSDCIVIDRGCCLGEKRAAVNKKAAEALQKTREEGCAALLKELSQDNKAPNLCRGRKFYFFRQNENPSCREKKCVIY